MSGEAGETGEQKEVVNDGVGEAGGGDDQLGSLERAPASASAMAPPKTKTTRRISQGRRRSSIRLPLPQQALDVEVGAEVGSGKKAEAAEETGEDANSTFVVRGEDANATLVVGRAEKSGEGAAPEAAKVDPGTKEEVEAARKAMEDLDLYQKSLQREMEAWDRELEKAVAKRNEALDWKPELPPVTPETQETRRQVMEMAKENQTIAVEMEILFKEFKSKQARKRLELEKAWEEHQKQIDAFVESQPVYDPPEVILARIHMLRKRLAEEEAEQKSIEEAEKGKA